MTPDRQTPRTLHDALHDGRVARSQAFYDSLSALTRWISGGRPQGAR